MKTRTDVTRRVVIDHFSKRAACYDDSSVWCTDLELLQRVYSLLAPKPCDLLLDIACGTGLVSQIFRGKVASVTGIDITEAMYCQGFERLDHFIQAFAEWLPFKSHSFDITLERQGIQFMDAEKAVAEMVRVTKPGGKICLIQLCAYGPEDQEEYFEILRLRNPARRNFFILDDLKNLLAKSGCREVQTTTHVSEEDVDRWAANGAIGSNEKQLIRDRYRRASDGFQRLHAVSTSPESHFIDRMLFGIAIGIKNNH